MRHSRKIKQTGTAFVLAAAMTVSPLLPSVGAMTALAASSPETEYDEATLEKFRDNVLEYWEIPGLIEQYNTDYKNQLETFYNNPDGATGLTRTQLLNLAKELRDEADELSDEAEDLKDEITKESYKDYQDNVHALRVYAKQLEEASEGKSAAGKSAIWGLKETRDKQTRDARALMREYQTKASQDKIKKKSLEIAELSCQSAQTKLGLSMATAEDVLNAEEALNQARAEATAAESSLRSAKRSLCTMLGWSYDDDPEILAVPEADLQKVDSFHPDTDLQTAIDNNYTMRTKRRTAASSFGGQNEKARTMKDLEEKIKTSLDRLYREIGQKQAAYGAASTQFEAAQADKSASDLNYRIGQTARQDYLKGELALLKAQADKESANLELTGAIEAYEWAVKGLLEIEGGTQ